MTRAQRIAIARHQLFADRLFSAMIARLPLNAALDSLFKRFYTPAAMADLFPLETPLLTEHTRVEFVPHGGRYMTFPLSVRR